MKCIVTGSKKILDFQVSSREKFVKYLCSGCGKAEIAEKHFHDEKQKGIYHRFPHPRGRKNFIRIIMGIHPEIARTMNDLTVSQSAIYFCAECGERLKIFEVLVLTCRVMAGTKFDEGLWKSNFIPGKGCWITMDKYAAGMRESNLNLQLSLDVFDAVLKRLYFFWPSNPFRIEVKKVLSKKKGGKNRG